MNGRLVRLLFVCTIFTRLSCSQDFLSVDQIRHKLLFDTSMSENEKDELAIKMYRANTFCRVFILYPRAVGHEKEIYDIVKKYSTILYEKKVFLTNHGPFHMIKQFYFDHPWFGDYGDKKDRVAKKAEKTFRHGAELGNPLRVLLLECPNDDYQYFRESKLAIRDIFGTQHVCHSDHRHITAIRMSQAVFSNPTIEFFNKRGLNYLPNIEQALQDFSIWLKDHKLSKEHICIVGKSRNAMYGVKDTDIIDFVCTESFDQEFSLPEQFRNVSNRKKYRAIKEALVNDHTQHFYHRGFKFAVKK